MASLYFAIIVRVVGSDIGRGDGGGVDSDVGGKVISSDIEGVSS